MRIFGHLAQRRCRHQASSVMSVRSRSRTRKKKARGTPALGNSSYLLLLMLLLRSNVQRRGTLLHITKKFHFVRAVGGEPMDGDRGQAYQHSIIALAVAAQEGTHGFLTLAVNYAGRVVVAISMGISQGIFGAMNRFARLFPGRRGRARQSSNLKRFDNEEAQC